LDNISLSIGEGEGVGIIGETGSGKTTLIQHFNGLLKPSSGKVWIEGKDLSQAGISLAELRQRVGLVFQYPEHQLFEDTVFNDISFVLRQRKKHLPQEIERRVRTACEVVGLGYEEFHRRSPFELSGGEMRRVALAGILIQEPPILILDEPTVGLDGPSKRDILREIGSLHRSGKSVIVVSHGVEDLLPIVNRLIVLEKGKIVADGLPSEVFAYLLKIEKHTYLVPPIYRLGHILQAEGWNIPEMTWKVNELLPLLDSVLQRNLFLKKAKED